MSESLVCDFCDAPTPAGRLAGWPCDTFELITATHGGALYIVCGCHTKSW